MSSPQAIRDAIQAASFNGSWDPYLPKLFFRFPKGNVQVLLAAVQQCLVNPGMILEMYATKNDNDTLGQDQIISTARLGCQFDQSILSSLGSANGLWIVWTPQAVFADMFGGSTPFNSSLVPKQPAPPPTAPPPLPVSAASSATKIRGLASVLLVAGAAVGLYMLFGSGGRS